MVPTVIPYLTCSSPLNSLCCFYLPFPPTPITAGSHMNVLFSHYSISPGISGIWHVVHTFYKLIQVNLAADMHSHWTVCSSSPEWENQKRQMKLLLKEGERIALPSSTIILGSEWRDWTELPSIKSRCPSKIINAELAKHFGILHIPNQPQWVFSNSLLQLHTKNKESHLVDIRISPLGGLEP